MTTAFELASTNAHQPWNITQVGDPYAVYNAHSRVSATRQANHTAPAATHQDTAAFSGTSSVLAAVAEHDDARAARIEALRQSIADGTYSVSSYRVAGAVVQTLL